MAFLVDEELGEIPGYYFGLSVLLLAPAAAQEAVDGVGVGSVDFHLVEEGELGAEPAGDELQYLLVGAALLAEELVARECQQLEPPLFEFVVHLGEELVVGGGESSLAGDVDHEYGFFVAVL